MRYDVSFSDTTVGGSPVPVKPLRSATRVLAVLEAVATLQPVGLGAVTRHLDEDKSAVLRAPTTLADDAWIRAVPGEPPRWELTTRALVMASEATLRSDLRGRVRPVLEALRDETDESVMLAIPDPPRIVTLDVVESRQLVRAAPHVGMVIPPVGSSAAQALLSHLSPAEVGVFLGREPDAAYLAGLAAVRRRGWALNRGDVNAAASGIATAVLDARGRPVAAIAVSAPTERLPRSLHASMGRRLAEAAAALSG
jgi:IclR family acetate operon transcriptional repressor